MSEKKECYILGNRTFTCKKKFRNHLMKLKYRIERIEQNNFQHSLNMWDILKKCTRDFAWFNCASVHDFHDFVSEHSQYQPWDLLSNEKSDDEEDNY